MMKIFKTIPVFFIFFIPSFAFSQQEKLKEIDVLLRNADYYVYVDFLKSMHYAKKASLKAEAINNSEKKAESYYYLARSFVFFKRHEESFFYIEKGMREPATNKNAFLKASFMDLKCINYSRLYLADQQIRELEKILSLLTPRNDPNSKIFLANVYMEIADHYTDANNLHLANIYSNKSIRSIETISDGDYIKTNRINKRKAFIYYYKAVILFSENKLDSTRYYMEKAYVQAISDHHVDISPFLALYGDYYFKKKDYHKALQYYLNVMQNKKKFKEHSADINKKISRVYGLLGDDRNEKLYLEKSSNDLLVDQSNNKNDIQIAIKSILKEEDHSNPNKENRKNLITILLSFTFVVILIYIGIKIHRTNQTRELNKKNNCLKDQSKIIYENEQRIEVLEQKLNDSFLELIEMAKKNNPQFWTRFQEVYPDFRENLVSLNSSMKTSELTLCAYIYFGFTSKEIGEYTFKSAKTIDNNRYNLRKKLQIPSEVDFSMWLKNMIKAQDK
ncbi:tetratricopeptide repeat protein [Chryseobacterium sp. R2ACT005]|uniref:tetratricopeptide repeat protein n=1 Tax=Chryseobacterium sp. R2ACT005 TaxID=3416668 RepID=UPI003CF6C3CC